MKPILINLNDMTDSREVYESKPNIILTIFIYSILAILLIAFLWTYLGRIDVVVKSDAMLRPNEQVATVMNTYSGTLERVNVKDGAKVSEGEILYVIEHEDLLSELSYYQEQLTETETTLELLTRYKESIEDGVNHFEASSQEEEYYLKYQQFELNLEQLEKDYTLTEDGFTYQEKERALSLDTVQEQRKDLQKKLSYAERLKKAVSTNKNLFDASGEEKEYYNLYLKYQSDYQSIITQYEKAKEEIDSSITKEGLVNSLKYYRNALEELQKLQTSITNSESAFEETSSYSLQYDQYVNKVADLETAYEQAKENYEINKELEGLAVTELAVKQSKTAMEEAKRAIDTYKTEFLVNVTSSINETENKIKELDLSLEHTASKDELYQKNDTDQSAAMENYELKYLVELDSNIATMKDNLDNLKDQEASLILQGEKNRLEESTNTRTKLMQYRYNELQTILTDIRTYSDKVKELQTGIDKLNVQISDTTVKAAKAGVINSNIELVTGDVLSSGTEVMTIIPADNSEYKASIYVSNEDIGKLKEGMDVKFNIYALPQSEYGYLTGTIVSISKDLKVDSASGSGYYLVEAKVEDKPLYDSQGEQGVLKSGMTCQAQMIIQKKRILVYLMEKIDMWINN